MKTTCLVSLALLAVASAVPASVKRWDPYVTDDSLDSCATTCSKQPGKFSYKTYTTYIYDYIVDTDTSMAGASEESAKLTIKARAEIQALDSCDFALLLKDVRVSHTDAYTGRLRTSAREDEFQRALESSTLRFSFNDGVISSVCPERSETRWALNFKRGLLSAFQNSMEKMDKSHTVSEVDVSGECEADFTVASTWAWKKETRVTKTKNLLSCSKRDSYRSMYQIIPYSVDSEIQSMPVMKSTHKCDYVISSSQVLQSASCEETHMFVPFSNRESGGKTKVMQKLTLVSQKDGVEAVIDPVKERLSLRFEHDDASVNAQNGPESLEQKLKEICDQTLDDIRPETPRLYSELVQIIKVLNKADLERAYKLVKDKIICPKNGRTLKFFMDALPMAGTEGSISLMTSLINSRQVEGVLAKSWLTSIALVQEPTSSMAEDGLKLLRGPFYSEAVLPVSALVNKFCKTTSGCENDYYISQILTFLQSKIPNSCYVDDKNLKEVLRTLRAIGNTGQSVLTSALAGCVRSASSSLEVKVAAADAYRRMPCDAPFDQRDTALWAVLKDNELDIELRIKSYLSVMRCPDEDTLTQISQLQNKMVDDHLGSFIYTHIKNLQETSDPLKQEIVKRINQHNFVEHELNLFKYSSNHEASVLINRLNMGFAADSNIIMSPNSPLPRSAMLNLTANLFGNSINLLEIGGRVEGLEILVEKLLGPTGYFPTKGDKRGDDKLDDVKGSIYARVFGNEVFFEQAKGTQGMRGPSSMPNFLDILISFANRQAVAYTYSTQLMDVSLTVPTIAGLPLEITVNGSVNLDLKAEGKADLRKVATSPRSMEIDGEFRPSAALEVTGTMAVVALSTRMGLRMRNTMHSSTWLKGHIEIDRGHVLKIEIDPPGDKMEIFNARSQFFIIHDEVEKEQNMIKDNYQEYKLCSGGKLATVLGVELCGEVKFPNASFHEDSPYFPLTGPTSLSIMTFRRDTHTSYKVLAMRKEAKDRSTAQFLMDTPNSKVNRMISADVSIGYTPDKQIDISLISPWKKLNLNSAVVANKGIMSFVGSVLMDDKDKYGLTTEVKISKTGSNVAYTPFIEITQSGKTDTLLSGLVNVDLPNKLDANLEIKGLEMLPYTVEGGLINQEKEKRVRLSLSKEGKNLYVMNVGTTIDISGKDSRNVKVEPTLLVKTQDQTLVSITGSSDYKHDKLAEGDLTVDIYRMKPASVSWKISQNTKGKQSNYDVDLKMKSSILTGTIDGDVSHQKNVLSSTLKVNYNIPKFGTDVVMWTTKFTDKSKNTFLKYQVVSNLDMKKYTDYNAGLNLRVDHKKKQTDVEADVKYGANSKDKKKTITINSSLNRGNLSWKNAELGFELKAKAPEKNVDLNMKMSHTHTPSKLDSNVNLKFAPYMKNVVDAGISLENKGNKMLSYLGQANLGIMGKKIAVSTDLTQTSAKQFKHLLDLQDFDGNSHSVNTVYKSLSSNGHEITSDVNINGYKPIQLQGKTILDLSNFQASADAVYGKDLYNISAQSKFTNSANKLNFGLVYPGREVEAEAEVKNQKEKVSGSFSVDWDAKRSTKSKVSVESSYRNSASKDSRVVSAAVNVKTPFTNLEDLSADASYSSDPAQYSTKGKVSWGGKQETVSSNLVVKRPLSLKNVEITFVAATPIRQYREIELEINHKLDETLATSAKGKLEDNMAELTVKGENRGGPYNRDFYGFVEMKTPFARLRDASVSLEHKDNGRSFKSVGSFGHNSRKFQADLQMDHTNSRSSMDNNGKLVISWPEDQLQTTWQHSLQGAKQIKSSLESKWSGNKRVVIDLIGSNNLESNLRQVLATLNVQTPWRNSREITVKFDNKLSSGRLESTASFLTEKVEKIVYSVLLEQNNKAGNVMFMLRSPLYEHKIHGQTQVKWDAYPVTTLAWLEWAPWARIDFDGSLNAPSMSDIELNTKLTTPFKNFENIIAGASHKLENSEYVSRTTVNYSVRKMINFENRLRFDDDVKLLRTKLTTPFSNLRSFNTGLRLSTNSYKVEGSADFELLPLVMKYDGFVTWNYNTKNWNGKLRLNTPLKSMPYFQIISWSKMGDENLRTSHVDIEPSSYGVYSLDSSYRFDLPLQLDMTVKTPHPQFESLGLTAVYNPSATALESRLRVMYQLNKAVDSQLKLDWADNFEGSLVVTTPFSRYENNKINARHDSNKRGFTFRGEANVGGDNAQGDVTYTSSPSATSGSASLISSLEGFEKLSAIFNVKGTLNRLKADASLNMGANILATTLTNNAGPGLLRSSLTINSPYSQDLKLSIQHKDTSSYSETNLESSFDGQYGDKRIDGKMGLSYAGLEKSKIDLSLNTPFKSGQISLENMITGDRVSGKGSIQTDIRAIGNIEASYDKNGPLKNMVGTVSVIRNGQSLVKTVVETKFPGDSLRVKVVTEGIWVPTITALVDHRGKISDFSTKTTVSDNQGNTFDNEVTFKIEDSLVDFRNNLNVKLNSVDLSHVMTIHKEGTLTDFKVDVSNKLDDDEVTAAVAFQANNQVKGSIEVNNLSSRYDKIGAEFEHTGDSEKFITSGKIMISSREAISGKVNFYRYNLKRVEATAELSTPWQGYRYSRVEYRHEGGDGRLSCNMNIQYGDGQKFSSDFITQRTLLASSLTFNVKTPFKGYEDILMSGDYDSSKINGKAVLGAGQEYTLSGVYDPSVYPYLIQYQITTPLDILKKATINLKGTPLDGTVDLVVVSFNKKVQGNGMFQYTSPYKLSLSTQLTSNIRGFTALQLNIKNDEDATRGKTSHLLVSWDPTKQVVVDGRLSTGKSRWASKQENVLELNVKLPFEKFQSIGLDIEHTADTDNVHGVMSLEVDQKKLVDLDINYDTSSKYAYSAIMRKPWPMEYTTSFQYDEYTKEGDVFVNWNRDDPSSNLRIKSSLQNRPSDNDKSLTLTYISPARTMGVEHSLASSADKLTSSGKLFWDQDDDSKLTYSLDISSSSRRRDTAYNGDFKLGFPSRTLGLSGSLSKNDVATTGDAAISWDLGRDDSKRLEVQATFSGQEYTKADISVKLPSDIQVKTALILNQGNTILDGKTDISYSRESRKTLTLFSKLRNTPTSYRNFFDSANRFNYSVELGVSHPETKVDVKIDSHVANSDEFMTSSLGVKYMTVRRQMKNLALFAEIDKIRKQISLVASGPTSSAGVSAKLVSDEPLSLLVLSSLDGQDKWKSTLDVDVSKQTFKFEIGQPDNLLSFRTFYPNSSAIQADIYHQNKQEAVVGLRLLNSHLLHSRIYWRPAAIVELSTFVMEQMSTTSKSTQDMLRQVNVDLRSELNGKFEQVTTSVVEDLKPLLKFAGDELESFARDLENVKVRLSKMHRDNEFFLQDISSAAIVNYGYASEAFTTMRDELQQLISLYRDTYRSLILTVLEKLDKIEQYSFLNSYNQVVTRAVQDLVRSLDGKITALVKSLKETDLQILERTKVLLSNVGDIYNHPQLDFIKSRIEQLRNIDYNYYMDRVNDAMKNSVDLNQYKNALYSWKDAAVNRVIPESVRDMAERATNELYQQAQLAYKHWDIEENFNKHVSMSAELLKDIVEDEVREYFNLFMIKNPVTLFDPENGRIEANFILPIAVKRLDRMPDLSVYTQRVIDIYNKYVPAKPAYLPQDSYYPLPDDVLLAELADFTPSKPLRNRYTYKS